MRYCMLPIRLRVQTLKKTEKILLILRRWIFNKYEEKGSLRKSELKGLEGFRDVRRIWHGMIKVVTTRATSFKKFRPTGIWNGLRFLLYYVDYTYNDLEREIDSYRRKSSIEQKVQREKRRNILDKIRNEELTAEVDPSKSKTFTLKESKDATNAKKIVTKKAPTSTIKSSNEICSSKSKLVTKKPTKKETKESKAASKKPTSTNTFTHGEGTSKRSFQKITPQKTNQKQSINLTPKTENQLSVSKNITMPSKSIIAPNTFGDNVKTPIIFNINIVVNDEILKGLTSQGLTMTINLAKE